LKEIKKSFLLDLNIQMWKYLFFLSTDLQEELYYKELQKVPLV
jgi:hypothetical protein